MILIILSLAIIATYVLVMIFKKGIPYSISDTYYSLEHKLWFGISMAATALLLMPSVLDLTPSSYQFTAFLMCAGLIFVGASPNFKAGLDRPVHISATCVAALNSQIWIVITEPWLLLIWIALIVYLAIRLKQVWNGNLKQSFVLSKPLFWAEITMFAMIYIELLLM